MVTLGFLDPDKVEEFSLPSHLAMVESGKLKKEDLPVFSYKRMTGEDRLLLGDKTQVEERMADSGNTVITSKQNEVTIETIKKYWVGATNLKIGDKDLSFKLGDNGVDMDSRIAAMPSDFLLYLYLAILNGSVWTDEEVKNFESRDTVPSGTKKEDSPAKQHAAG